MKKYALLLFYALFIILLLTFRLHPLDFSLAGLFSILIVPVSIFTIVLGLFLIVKGYSRFSRISSLLIILVAVYQLSQLISLNFNEQEEGDIRLISLNASFFSIPGVFSPEYFDPVRPNVNDSLVNWLVEEYPDFLLLQEFFDDEKSTAFNNIQNLLIRGEFKDYYFLRDPQHDNGVSRGLVIFSRWPILNKKELFLGENRFNGAQEVVVNWRDRKLKIVNLHLQSSEFNLKGAMKSLGSMRYEVMKVFRDTEERANQVDMVLQKLSEEDLPTIIAGDFNSTRYSYVYHQMSERYQNSFKESGTGFGFTFHALLNIPLQLDHQFFSSGLKNISTTVVDSLTLSEHQPVIGSYSLD